MKKKKRDTRAAVVPLTCLARAQRFVLFMVFSKTTLLSSLSPVAERDNASWSSGFLLGLRG